MYLQLILFILSVQKVIGINRHFVMKMLLLVVGGETGQGFLAALSIVHY